ncbi:TPA: hypothetical protein GDO54_018427 [Pyxicephalus adspersus]|uniref:Uncharacterized protein n=1 Tax=Pyxicephalus adspersus TaxID=30357 RepID=A0AAV2ZDD0_PYXAD|nr:TPA: hypothetical protein GDO54_018427 [Pyxicephalus adspersus]
MWLPAVQFDGPDLAENCSLPLRVPITPYSSGSFLPLILLICFSCAFSIFQADCFRFSIRHHLPGIHTCMPFFNMSYSQGQIFEYRNTSL